MRSRTHHPVGLTLAPNTNPHIPIPGRRVFCANRINGHPPPAFLTHQINLKFNY